MTKANKPLGKNELEWIGSSVGKLLYHVPSYKKGYEQGKSEQSSYYEPLLKKIEQERSDLQREVEKLKIVIDIIEQKNFEIQECEKCLWYKLSETNSEAFDESKKQTLEEVLKELLPKFELCCGFEEYCLNEKQSIAYSDKTRQKTIHINEFEDYIEQKIKDVSK